VTATVKGEEVPGLISSLFYHIKPAVRTARGDLQRSIVENTRIQAQLLAETSPVIAKRVRAGLLVVAAGVYDLASGLVTPIELD
jgi:carbonic anhydrase